MYMDAKHLELTPQQHQENYRKIDSDTDRQKHTHTHFRFTHRDTLLL
jgi:hypothetical protein